MRTLFLTILFSCLCLGPAVAAPVHTTPMQDNGVVLLVTGDNAKIQSDPDLRRDDEEEEVWPVLARLPAGSALLAEQWPVTEWSNEYLWYKVVAIVETPDGKVRPIQEVLSNTHYGSRAFVSNTEAAVTPWVGSGLDREAVLHQLAALPYGQGYTAIDNSMAGQKKLVESKELVSYDASLAAGKVALHEKPSVDSGLITTFSKADSKFHQARMRVVDTSVPGWVRVESLNGLAPSGWVQKKLVDYSHGEAKNAGVQFIFNIGANAPDIIRHWGPDVAINSLEGENHGHTHMAFEGMVVNYQDHNNMYVTLSRKGAGIGGIFIDTKGYDRKYIKRIYGDILVIDKGEGYETWKVEGFWDGWWYVANLEFDEKGLVSQIDFTCQDVDLSH